MYTEITNILFTHQIIYHRKYATTSSICLLVSSHKKLPHPPTPSSVEKNPEYRHIRKYSRASISDKNSCGGGQTFTGPVITSKDQIGLARSKWNGLCKGEMVEKMLCRDFKYINYHDHRLLQDNIMKKKIKNKFKVEKVKQHSYHLWPR